MRYDANNEICAHCSDHYFDGKGMYVDCEGKYCEEAELDVIGFSCPATEDFEDLTLEEEAEAQDLEDPEITPAKILYKLDAARYAKEVEGLYQHKCNECGELFTRKGKIHFICDKCQAKHDADLPPREKDHAQAQIASNKIHKRPSGVSGGGHVIKPGVSGQPSTDPMLKFGITSDQLEDHFRKYPPGDLGDGGTGIGGSGAGSAGSAAIGHSTKPGVSGIPITGPGLTVNVTIKSADPVPGDDEILNKLADSLNRQAANSMKLK